MKIDVGCGPNKQKDHIGVDKIQFAGVDVICDVGREKWPFADDTVDEIHCSHLVEHLTAPERVHFVNEAHRVLKKGGKVLIVTPHWASARAYGDLTHQWPPVSEFWYPYLSAEWRAKNAPHNVEYTCDFDCPPGGYGLRDDLKIRNHEYQQYALINFKEAAQDLAQTVIKR
jgi:SAM-dependent methyltransferase